MSNVKQEDIERILRFNCPSGCDGNGSYPEQTADDEWEQGQCQWCFEYGMPARDAINQQVVQALEKVRDDIANAGEPAYSTPTSFRDGLTYKGYNEGKEQSLLTVESLIKEYKGE